MAATKRFICRTHPGGVFEKVAARGRQPVRCTADYPCDKSAEVSNTIRDVPGVGKVAIVTAAEAPKADNISLPLAMAAKERLIAREWVVKGRAWIDDTDDETNGPWAEITASRDEETLVMKWHGGYLVEQNYSMEFLKPSQNGVPGRQLSFDPDELTDSELVKMIKGMRVTWWNTIGGSYDSAVIGDKVTIEHIFFSNGDEDNTKRIVKFVDRNAGGFRAFHVTALVKVG